MAVVEKRMRQREAAERLGVTQRQVKRLAARYRVAGVAGLASRRRGQRPNNAIAEAKRGAILELVQQRYADFPPTLAHEKLTEGHGYRLSVETLRGWLIEAGLWQPQARRRARLHPPRERRPCVGELVQIDGSPHDWFEGRAARCCLLAFVDDATSRLLALRFWEAETTQAYMQTLREYLQQHGRPVALYSDKHSIFRVNRPDREGEWTQFTRALKELDIEPIHAHTPQAKGRVERAFQTLQTRLPRELRLRGLDGIGAANAFLPHYRADYNARFGQAPRSEQDAHREVGRQAIELDRILCPQQVRRLSKNLTFKFQGSTYGIQGQGKGYRLRHAAVTLCAGYDGKLTVLYPSWKRSGCWKGRHRWLWMTPRVYIVRWRGPGGRGRRVGTTPGGRWRGRRWCWRRRKAVSGAARKRGCGGVAGRRAGGVVTTAAGRSRRQNPRQKSDSRAPLRPRRPRLRSGSPSLRRGVLTQSHSRTPGQRHASSKLSKPCNSFIASPVP